MSICCFCVCLSKFVMDSLWILLQAIIAKRKELCNLGFGSIGLTCNLTTFSLLSFWQILQSIYRSQTTCQYFGWSTSIITALEMENQVIRISFFIYYTSVEKQIPLLMPSQGNHGILHQMKMSLSRSEKKHL